MECGSHRSLVILLIVPLAFLVLFSTWNASKPAAEPALTIAVENSCNQPVEAWWAAKSDQLLLILQNELCQ